jgi:hypothetical protein
MTKTQTLKTLAENKRAVEALAEGAAPAARKGKNQFDKKRSDSFPSHISKVKQVRPAIRISNKAILVTNSFISDIFEKVSTEGARLVDMNDRNTLASRETHTAVRLVLPGDLAENAGSEGGKGVGKSSVELIGPISSSLPRLPTRL